MGQSSRIRTIRWRALRTSRAGCARAANATFSVRRSGGSAEAAELESADEIGGERDDHEACVVGVEINEWEPVQAGVFETRERSRLTRRLLPSRTSTGVTGFCCGAPSHPSPLARSIPSTCDSVSEYGRQSRLDNYPASSPTSQRGADIGSAASRDIAGAAL